MVYDAGAGSEVRVLELRDHVVRVGNSVSAFVASDSVYER